MIAANLAVRLYPKPVPFLGTQTVLQSRFSGFRKPYFSAWLN